MLKCSLGFWQKRELYKIEKSLIVFEKKNIMLKTWRLAPGYPNSEHMFPKGSKKKALSLPKTSRAK